MRHSTVAQDEPSDIELVLNLTFVCVQEVPKALASSRVLDLDERKDVFQTQVTQTSPTHANRISYKFHNCLNLRQFGCIRLLLQRINQMRVTVGCMQSNRCTSHRVYFAYSQNSNQSIIYKQIHLMVKRLPQIPTKRHLKLIHYLIFLNRP